MKRIVVYLLAAIGAFWLAFFALRLVGAATDKQGFWWSYLCSAQPVTFAEVDTDQNGQIEYREASLMCNTYKLKRSIAGETCFEYVEPKTGEPLQTVCRNDAASAP